MNNQQEAFIRWELASRDTIDVKRVYIDMAEDLVSGVVLSQIIYWFLPNKRGKPKTTITFDDRDWIAKHREDWFSECRISPDQSDRALKHLVELNLIVTEVKYFNKVRCIHISVNWEVIVEKLKILLAKDFDLDVYWKTVWQTRKTKTKSVNHPSTSNGSKSVDYPFSQKLNQPSTDLQIGDPPISLNTKNTTKTTLSENTSSESLNATGNEQEAIISIIPWNDIREVLKTQGLLAAMTLRKSYGKSNRTDLHHRLITAIDVITGGAWFEGQERNHAKKLVRLVNEGNYTEEDIFECLEWAYKVGKLDWHRPSLTSIIKLLPEFKTKKDSGSLDKPRFENKEDRKVRIYEERDYEQITRDATEDFLELKKLTTSK